MLQKYPDDKKSEAYPIEDDVIIELLLKFQTNTILEEKGDTQYLNLLKKESIHSEYHFAKFEAEVKGIKVDKSINESLKNIKIGDWVITDFDNYLKGNPF